MNAIVERTESPVAPLNTPDRLMALAIEHGADVDKLAKLMDLQERWNAQKAREAYYEALAKFQHILPPIPRDKIVKNRDGSERYRYATLDQILTYIKEPMFECGLSWSWSPGVPTEEGVATTCTITHTLGHSESSTAVIPGITSGGTNAAQDAGGANTYGRRYSMINVLGIQAVDDLDAQGVKGGPLEAIMNMLNLLRDDTAILRAVATIKDGLAEGGDIGAAAEAYAELTRDEVEALWLAPTKGGLFTTENRRVMKEQDFREAVQEARGAKS